MVVDVKMPTYDKWDDPEFEVLLYEFKDGLNAYLKSAGSPHASLKALIDWNTAHARDRHALLRPGDLREGREEGAAHRCRLPEGTRHARGGWPARMDCWRRSRQDKLDAVIAPSTAPAWLTDHVLGDHFAGAGYGIAAVAGTPEPDRADG